jgi:uncharacterized protein YbcI
MRLLFKSNNGSQGFLKGFNPLKRRQCRLRAAAISDAITALHRSYYGKEPREVRTYLNDRVICCVLSEPFTSFEKELFGGGAGLNAGVCEVWQSFQDSMSEKFKQTVAALTGREVTAFFSRANSEPDLVIEIFQLGRVSE